MHSSRQLSAAAVRQQQAAESLANHLSADMMHDALRGDVLTLLRTSSPAAHDEAAAELDEHAEQFVSHLASNEALVRDPRILQGLREIRPALDAYIEQARKLELLTRDDQGAAEAGLPAFFEAFEDLEQQQAAVSELIETQVDQAGADAEAARRAATFCSAWWRPPVWPPPSAGSSLDRCPSRSDSCIAGSVTSLTETGT